MTTLRQSEPSAPIFIVGLPRSGTTLLASMLAAHSRIACGPETHFFSRLSGKKRQAAVKGPWPDHAVDVIQSLKIARKSVSDLFELSRADLREKLRTMPPSESAMLRVLTETYALASGKPRWAEKTPNHLLYVEHIRALYPDARIIRIVRDPRDSVLSITKNLSEWFSDSNIANACFCSHWLTCTQPFFDIDEGSLTVKYEDLVKDAKDTMIAVCDFIGEQFESAMMDTRESGKRLATPGEPWKKQVSEPLDPSRLYVWRHSFPSRELKACEYILRDILIRFGYEVSSAPGVQVGIWPWSARAIRQNEGWIVGLADSGVGCVPLEERIFALRKRGVALSVLLGIPPLGDTTRIRGYRVAEACACLIWLRWIKNIAVYRMPLLGPPIGSAERAWVMLVASQAPVLTPDVEKSVRHCRETVR